MSPEERRKFNLGDIIRKLNEGEPSSAAPSIDKTDKGPRSAPATFPSPPARKTELSDFHQSSLSSQPAFGVRPPSSSPLSPLPESPRKPAAARAQSPSGSNPEDARSITTPIEPSKSAAPDPQDPDELPDSPLSDAGEEEESFDFFRYLGVVLRRKELVLGVAIVATIYSIWSYMGGVKLYTAKARLLFRPGQQAVISERQPGYAYMIDREKAINTHLVLLKSRTVLDQVSENTGRQISSDAIAASLIVSQGGEESSKNDIIEVSFKSPRAELARDVVNELCNTYIEYRRTVNEQEKSRFIGKLQTQIDKVQKELNSREDALRQFRENNKMVELSSETNLSVQKYSSMNLALQETNLSLVESQKRYAATRQQLSEQEARIIESLSFNNVYQARLADLEMQLTSLSSEYSTEHFKVRMVRQQVDSLRAAMKSEIQSQATQQNLLAKDPFRVALIEDLAKLAIEKNVLESKVVEQRKIMEQLNGEILKLPAMTQNYVNLQRETEAQVQTLRTLKQSLEEAKIIRDSQESDLKLLEVAELPRTAISSKKINSIFIGILVGIILGIALAFLVEYLDQSLKNPGDVEKILEIPLIGFVPFIQAEKPMIDEAEKLEKSVMEPFRAVRTNLKHLTAKYDMQAIMVCSAVKGEGKTTLAANLAITFAVDGKTVVLVDGDLRRPQIHKLFSLNKEVGVAEYLKGELEVDQVMKKTRYPGLFVVTCGTQPDNPAELVGTIRFSQLIEDLKKRVEVVLFDSPAILPVSDAITMAPKLDGILMVVRAFWTPIKAAKQARNQLRRMGCRVFGGILNGVSHSRSYYPYYYGYYGYYSYKYSYDYDRDPKKAFSWRELGLSAEGKIKEFLQNSRQYAPHYLAWAGRYIRYMLRKPLFWILLVLLVALAFVEVTLRPSKDRVTQGIQYLSEADSVRGKEIMGDPAGEVVPLEGVAAGSVSSVGSERSSDEEGSFLRDSVAAWCGAFNSRSSQRYFSYYDSAEFSYSGGRFSAFRQNMERVLLSAKNFNSILLIDSVLVGGFKNPFCKVVVLTTAITASDTFHSTINQVWKSRDNTWRIVRQNEEE